jgi:hypothetical protein
MTERPGSTPPDDAHSHTHSHADGIMHRHAHGHVDHDHRHDHPSTSSGQPDAGEQPGEGVEHTHDAPAEDDER